MSRSDHGSRGGREDYLIAYCPETVGAGGLGENMPPVLFLARCSVSKSCTANRHGHHNRERRRFELKCYTGLYWFYSRAGASLWFRDERTKKREKLDIIQ